MKKLINITKYIPAIILSILVLPGCQDFLTTAPSDQYSVDNFWKSEEEAQAGLTGVYETLRGYSANQVFYSSQITPNAARFDNPGGWRDIARGLAQTTNELFASAWFSNYQGIGRANTLLANVDKLEADAEVINEIKGQAKFLRAFFYADLVNKFGDVPLILDAPNLEEQGDLPRTPKGEVITQVLKIWMKPSLHYLWKVILAGLPKGLL